MTGSWGFYGREPELGALVDRLRGGRFFLGAIRGRRRIGKTALVQQAFARLRRTDDRTGRPTLVFQLSDSAPEDNAADFRDALRRAGLAPRAPDLGEGRGLVGIAQAVGELCASGAIVVLDEFQVCHRGPLRGLPSLLQSRVDALRDRAGAGGLLLLGSVQTEMEALLADRRAPLYGRANFSLTLGPWSAAEVLGVAGAHGAGDPSRFLTLWTLFGGVPWYWRLYAENEALHEPPADDEWTARVLDRLFLRFDAALRDEGETLLGREVRGHALGILRMLARKRRLDHGQLRDSVREPATLGPYLRTLVRDLRLVEKELPVFAPENSRRARYSIADPFLLAWLAAIRPASAERRYLPLRETLGRLLPRLQTLEGFAFERFVRDASEEASRRGCSDFPMTDLARGYWTRSGVRGEPVEIDFIAWNESRKTVRFGSCKRSGSKHTPGSIAGFERMVGRFLAAGAGSRFRNFDQERALFAAAFDPEQRAALESRGFVCRDLADFRELLAEHHDGTTFAHANIAHRTPSR